MKSKLTHPNISPTYLSWRMIEKYTYTLYFYKISFNASNLLINITKLILDVCWDCRQGEKMICCTQQTNYSSKAFHKPRSNFHGKSGMGKNNHAALNCFMPLSTWFFSHANFSILNDSGFIKNWQVLLRGTENLPSIINLREICKKKKTIKERE